LDNQLQNNQRKIEGIAYFILFLSGILGMSLGYIVFRLELQILAMILTVFSAFLIVGLILNKRLIEQNNLIFIGFQQENLIKKHNILSAFIRELEFNSNVEKTSQFRAVTWKNLKLELCAFPDSIYEIVEEVYLELNGIPDIQGPELKDYLLKESKLTSAIAALRDQQNKVKRNIIG
jgi:hypothetical protein